MENYFKFTGKIIGIAYQGVSCIIIKLAYNAVYSKTAQDNGWREITPDCKDNVLLIPYYGADNLTQKQVLTFAFSPNVPRTTLGYGVDICNLFTGDEVDVYVEWYCSKPSCQRYVNKVIVAMHNSSRTQKLHDFVAQYG